LIPLSFWFRLGAKVIASTPEEFTVFDAETVKWAI
jgi:hypothetical protein